MIEFIKQRFLTKEFIKFLIVGVTNTFSNYIIYLILMKFLNVPYKPAYVIGYALSLVISYFLNVYFTYKSKPSIKSFLIFPISYLPNFLIQYFGVILLVDLMKLSPSFAPLITTAIALPLTFLLTRLVIKGKGK